MKTLATDHLAIEIHPDRPAMGKAAAAKAASILRNAIGQQGSARLIVASAPSQDELLENLAAAPDLDWSVVTIFHMDEYLGLPAGHPATFRAYQESGFLTKIRPAAFHGIRGESLDIDSECERYAALLAEAPIDLVCMGIGENGHIAFNDPPVADFNDPLLIKPVTLDAACRLQQVHDGCFPDLDSVPTRALTLTCPALMSAEAVVCVVPGPRKAAAIRSTLTEPIHPSCPATIVRLHPHAVLYLEKDSAHLLFSS
ncbi:MAG: glucosamine-6-phosphate deaminase [Verrucomicrobiales bacterium]|nr:glucosamine-6-phosphate deaminase [Verrucomicrobiales bacterium]